MFNISQNKTKTNKELVETFKKIKEYKLACEANICGIIYKNPECLYDIPIKIEDFSNNIWKVYFAIAYGIVISENKSVLDEITVGLYLEKHLKLKQKYEEYGGFETISKASEYVEVDNLYGYIKELHKWNAVIKLAKLNFPIADRLSEFVDMSAEDIYNEYEAVLNHIFVNVESDIKSYNACEGIFELIEQLDKGLNVGLPLHNCKILNREISGLNLGNIIGLGSLSGVGKSTTAINWLLPSMIEHDEKLVFIINEEDETKIQRELIIWVANNVFKQKLNKYILRDGNFTEETKELLKKCATWLEEKKDKRNITVIPLERYTTDIVVKIIKKYASMGVKYFCIDTLKEDADYNTDKTWLEMTRNMVRLYDVIKSSAKNVCLIVTYQLGKVATKQRYYTNNEIGVAKSIVDTMSVNIMMRKPFQDEFEGGKNEIKGYRLEGKNGLTKIPFKLNPDEHYMILFITKNRFGATNSFQIIAKYDLSLNIYQEIGICNIPQDF